MRTLLVAVAAVSLVACSGEQQRREQLALQKIEIVEQVGAGDSMKHPAPGNVFAVVHLSQDPGRQKPRNVLHSVLEDWDGRTYEMQSGSVSQSASGHSGLFGGWKETRKPDRFQLVFEIPKTATPRSVTLPQKIDVPFPDLYAGVADQPPRAVYRVEPLYPERARRIGLPATVKLEVLVKADGSVAGARMIDGFGILGDAAASAVRQWRYTPAIVDGNPAPALVEETIRFRR